MRRASPRYQGERPRVAPTSEHIQCSGKRQYPSYRDADHVAGLVRKNKDGERMSAYRCKFCQAWHIGGNGHLEKARRRR